MIEELAKAWAKFKKPFDDNNARLKELGYTKYTGADGITFEHHEPSFEEFLDHISAPSKSVRRKRG